VLAQLEHRADVERAEVDRRGELLRIRLRAGGAVFAIRDELERMGFAAEVPADTSAADARWYGISDVGELSRDEGQVIASRVVPPFAAAHGLAADAIATLSERVAAALYACFVGHRDTSLPPGGLAVPCGRAVEDAAAPLIGRERAAALGRAIEADLSGR
jgi:hypothetical protein